MPETIKSYTDAVNAQFTAAGESATELVEALVGLTDDVVFLNETIKKLQNNPGPISTEDQALLDAGVPRGAETVKKLKAVADAAKALNEATKRPLPEPPVEPPVDEDEDEEEEPPVKPPVEPPVEPPTPSRFR